MKITYKIFTMTFCVVSFISCCDKKKAAANTVFSKKYDEVKFSSIEIGARFEDVILKIGAPISCSFRNDEGKFKTIRALDDIFQVIQNAKGNVTLSFSEAIDPKLECHISRSLIIREKKIAQIISEIYHEDLMNFSSK